MLPLTELLRVISETTDFPVPADATVTSITSDSRNVAPGSLFVAIRGTKGDGAEYIASAREKGAVAVVCDRDVKAEGVLAIRVENTRGALSRLAAKFYPRQPEHIVAVTGTDGKTSTVDFYRQLWHHMGRKSASIGTFGVRRGGEDALDSDARTTPDPVALHHTLSGLAYSGVTHVGMEASSHGLDQFRLDGVRLEAAAFTNLTRDHLDYHGTDEAYFQAKRRLFDTLLPVGATAVLNQDDARFEVLKETCQNRGVRVLGYGKAGEDFRVAGITPNPQGQTTMLELHGKPVRLEVPLVGAFQVMNILAALALVEATGGQLEEALAAVPALAGVPGRLEHIATLANGASVFIDYAHTPMALANILSTLRPHTQHHLHVVFGCGGDRDAGKRPEMGKAADRLADHVIVTDDNPRSEDAALIRKAVLAGAPRGKEVADRRQAIYAALTALNAGDVLVVAGKGHEKTQTVGDKQFPFDDAEVIRELVKTL